ncbi:MAG: cation:proton antiporter, partial [Bacilli bacterium]|nr:cation:proton antiporter [Bacilli bacterium]
ATATAPAATLMVVRQYKAHGPVVESLLPVVAFDDAIGLMIFSISFAISKILITGDALSFKTAFLDPILEIIFSLAIGIALGFILSFSIRLFKSRANRLGLMIMSVIAGVGFAKWLNLSDLLICMMIGAVFCNMRTDSEKILEGTDRWTPPLFMLFFIISGADLKINVLFNIAIISIAVVYILCRSLGKYFGAAFGAKVTKSHPNIIKYLGLTLLPQAGVAIGMASIVKNNAIAGNFDMDAATTIQTVVLFATLVYELIGPVITKIALIKAGEIDVPDKKESIPETNNNQVITNIEEPKK